MRRLKTLFAFISAGVGRTGVFITLSIVLERIRQEGVVDVFQTVKVLRTQRPAMVQTEVKLVLLFISFTRIRTILSISDVRRGSWLVRH